MFMSVFFGGGGKAHCFGEVEIVNEVDTLQASPEINRMKGELKGSLNHRPLRSSIIVNLRGRGFAVCTNVNSDNFRYSV